MHINAVGRGPCHFIGMADFASASFPAIIVALPSGEPLRIRPIRPDDAGGLAAMWAQMAAEDLRPRFFSAGQALSPERLAQLTRLDAAREFVLIAEPVKGNDILGVALFRTAADRGDAEFAVIVRSDWKGRGIGWMLMQRLVDAARERDIGALSGAVLRANTNMLQFCRDLGFAIVDEAGDPLTVHAALTFRAPAGRD